MYTEHLRVWNGFSEPTCAWFKAFHANCTNKHTGDDFLRAFEGLVDSMRARGFVSERGSSIPTSPEMYPINGAHRIARSASRWRPTAAA